MCVYLHASAYLSLPCVCVCVCVGVCVCVCVSVQLFRSDLISAMKLPDSLSMESSSYFTVKEAWRREWEFGVQVLYVLGILSSLCVRVCVCVCVCMCTTTHMLACTCSRGSLNVHTPTKFGMLGG